MLENPADPVRVAIVRTGLHTVIVWLEENIDILPSLPDKSDVDMALMYLRHAERHLKHETGEPT